MNGIVLFRKDYQKLLTWKSKKNHFPIIIRGLRQVGKSYLAEYFANNEYGEEYVPVLDFRHNKSLSSIFNNVQNLSVENIIERIKLYFPDKKIEKGKTCIVMDEIGDCDLARESFKLFKDDSGYDIIATGSLLGLSEINGSIKDIPIGYEEYLDMRPLDFEEFLIASKVSKYAINELKKCVSDETEVPEAIHNIIKSHLSRYIVVGGMPAAVIKYLSNGDMNEVYETLCNLRKDFEDDFGKKKDKNGKTIIDSTLLVRTIRAYRSIPNQLAKENKKFIYSYIDGGGRSSEFSDAIAWLNKTDIISLAYNLNVIESPLAGNSVINEFKVYPTDIGLLISNYPITIVKEILEGNLGAYKGAIYEGLAADMLYKEHFPLYYFANTAKHLENDFIIETNDGLIIVESKATNGKMASSKAIMGGQTPYKVHKVYKLINGNVGEGAYFTSIPQYLFPFLLEKINSDIKSNLLLNPLPSI